MNQETITAIKGAMVSECLGIAILAFAFWIYFLIVCLASQSRTLRKVLPKSVINWLITENGNRTHNEF
jgi:hypothetical protein